MKATIGLFFVLYCVTAEKLSSLDNKAEPIKQEKRSLSYGALDSVYPSFELGGALSPGSASGPFSSFNYPASASSVGISTNTNTLTTIRENVPVPVDRPVPQPYPVIK